MANSSWNAGNKAAQQNKLLPNLNKMAPKSEVANSIGLCSRKEEVVVL